VRTSTAPMETSASYMYTADRRPVLWIGLFEVKPRPGSPGPDWWTEPPKIAGAFVNALGMAEDLTAFEEKVKSALDAMDLEAVSIDDVEAFDQRALRHKLDEDLIELAREARESNEVMFDTFHTYPHED
jgi:hypothetical protein